MKALGASVAGFLGMHPSEAQIGQLSSEQAANRIPGLARVGFEEFRPEELDPVLGGVPGIPNPLRYLDLTIRGPLALDGGFCSTPTCRVDPENRFGGNNVLFLEMGSFLIFEKLPPTVVLDLQGMGDSPFTVVVEDGSGTRERIEGMGVPFGQSLLGLVADEGVSRIEVADVGGTGGPLSLAAVYFTVPEPGAGLLLLGGGGLLVAFAPRRRHAGK